MESPIKNSKNNLSTSPPIRHYGAGGQVPFLMGPYLNFGLDDTLFFLLPKFGSSLFNLSLFVNYKKKKRPQK